MHYKPVVGAEDAVWSAKPQNYYSCHSWDPAISGAVLMSCRLFRHWSLSLHMHLTWHFKLNISQNHCIYFTYQFGEEPLKDSWEGRLFQKTWEVIGRAFCPLRSKWTNPNLNLLFILSWLTTAQSFLLVQGTTQVCHCPWWGVMCSSVSQNSC